MSGSGGSAFLDLLRALAPAELPVWTLIFLAALVSMGVAAALLAITGLISVRFERRFASHSAAKGHPGSAPMLAFACTFGAMAVYPLAPHVFFADLEIGLFVILALLSVASLGIALDSQASGSESAASRAMGEVAQWTATWIPIVLALLVAVIIGGTANLIEASRLQSGWFGMGWCVFKNPFALPALALFFVAAIPAVPCSFAHEHTRMFLLSAIAAVFFLGGFESPLTWGLRQSLGEDPGFMNHVVLADGSTQTRLAIGGLVFQFVCAGTLVVKALVGIAAMFWLRSKSSSPSVISRIVVGRKHGVALGLACVFGAGLWEWVRAVLWSGA